MKKWSVAQLHCSGRPQGLLTAPVVCSCCLLLVGADLSRCEASLLLLYVAFGFSCMEWPVMK